MQKQQKLIEEQKHSYNIYNSVTKSSRLGRLTKTRETIGSQTEAETFAAKTNRETKRYEKLDSEISREVSMQIQGKPARCSYTYSKDDVKNARLKKFEGPVFVEQEEADIRDDSYDSSGTENQASNTINQARTDQSHVNESEITANTLEEIAEGINGKENKLSLCTIKRIAVPERSETVGERIIFDPKSGAPVSHPLKSLEEALAWRPGFDEFNISRVPLTATELQARDTNQVKTLVCHDMRGGYIEDR